MIRTEQAGRRIKNIFPAFTISPKDVTMNEMGGIPHGGSDTVE